MKVIWTDIDGTISNDICRIHYLTEKGGPQWEKFYAEQHRDLPYHFYATFLKTFFELGWELVFATGRPERFREETLIWLRHYIHPQVVPNDKCLLMRPNGRDERAQDIKLNYLHKTPASLWPEFVLEDNPYCIAMYQAQGIPVVDVRKQNGILHRKYFEFPRSDKTK